MNILNQIAEENNLNYFKKECTVCGKINGIQVVIMQIANTKGLLISSTARFNEKPDVLANIEKAIADYSKDNKKVKNYHVSGYTISATMYFNSSTAFRENLKLLLKHMTSQISDNGISECCEACGTATQTMVCAVNDKTACLCSGCFNDIQEKNHQKEVENATASSNIPMGVVGALLGSLVGGIVWVVLYQLGYVAAITGLIGVVLSYKGYVLFAKKKGVKEAVISTVIAFVMILAAHFVVWGILLYQQVGGMGFGDLMQCIRTVPAVIFSDSELISAFVTDLIYGYVFMAVGSFSFIYNAIKNPTDRVEVKVLSSETSNV